MTCLNAVSLKHQEIKRCFRFEIEIVSHVSLLRALSEVISIWWWLHHRLIPWVSSVSCNMNLVVFSCLRARVNLLATGSRKVLFGLKCLKLDPNLDIIWSMSVGDHLYRKVTQLSTRQPTRSRRWRLKHQLNHLGHGMAQKIDQSLGLSWPLPFFFKFKGRPLEVNLWN